MSHNLAQKVNLPIEYNDKPVAPYGGMALMKRFVDRVGIREYLAELDLHQPGSNRGYTSGEILESFWLNIWTGTSPNANSALTWDAENRLISTTVGTTTYDGNGNISEYLDETGAIAAHYEYAPFGTTTTLATGPKAADFAHRFSTKPLDTETGLYYYGYRYYDPVTGRWPSRDPIEEEGGVNLYAFVENDGVNYWDYLGMCKDDSNGWRLTDLGLEVMPLDEMNPQQPDINKASRWFFKQVKKGARDFDDTTLKWAYGVEVSVTYECCICEDDEYFWGGGDTLTDSDDSPHNRMDARSRGLELMRALLDQISCD